MDTVTGSRLVPQGPASIKSEADVLRTKKKNFFLYDRVIIIISI